MEIPKTADNYRADVAHIGKSVLIKGELSGSEDLYLDGEVEGNILLRDHNLTIGPNGRVRANIQAKDVVVHGKVDGNVSGTDRVELKRSAVLTGDIATLRIVIEDGAFFKGAIDIKKEGKAEATREKSIATPASYSSGPAPSVPSYNASSASGSNVGGQSTLLDQKKV
ncbi:MAG: polymer-forming cytoskeletal protein [Acidobacteriota bacterium]|nr:polymer-forming cytoskeletal protein [Acidobacteriota bacterium]